MLKIGKNNKFKNQECLVKTALACLGKKFKYGASLTATPLEFDCSSLIQYLFHQIDITLPRTSIEQAHLGRIVKKQELVIGDLLFFRGQVGHYNLEFPAGIGHVAMYIGDDQVIQALGSVGRVIVTSINELMQRNDLVVIKRVL